MCKVCKLIRLGLYYMCFVCHEPQRRGRPYSWLVKAQATAVSAEGNGAGLVDTRTVRYLVNDLSLVICQLFPPFLNFFRHLPYPVGYFTYNFQRCIGTIGACKITRELFVCNVRIIFKISCWFNDI